MLGHALRLLSLKNFEPLIPTALLDVPSKVFICK
jgi:hypothetical protein